jgi:hypothetical protein
MIRFRTEEPAKSEARNRGQHFGFSCFYSPGGFNWYVGTPEELHQVGVVECCDPNKGESAANNSNNLT